jgi:aspartate aminotransferase-like enzyme
MKAYEDLSLFTPGPVNMPPRVLAAGARPMLHHRTEEASKLFIGVAEKVQKVLGTKEDVLFVHTTGRGAMEGTILNLFSPGEEIVAVCNGKFGEMYAEIAAIHGIIVHRVCIDWLKPIKLEEIEEALKSNPKVKAVTVCHCETATARLNDIKAVAGLAKRYGILSMVDCISSAGCVPIEFDEWQIDVLVTASQKGFMSPAGLSFVVLSQAAWSAVDSSTFPKFYIRFRDIQKNLRGRRPETPGTTPMSLVASVHESLSMILEEGKENCYARHETVARAIREGLKAMGLKLFPEQEENRSPALTAVQVGKEVSAALKAELKKNYGIIVAGGLGKDYKDSVVRIAHMGHVYPKDALTVIAATEASLFKIGHLQDLGKGVSACIREITDTN